MCLLEDTLSIGVKIMGDCLWSNYTTNEIKQIIKDENPVVIVPVGATEQHGPHLPLNTDTDIGFQIAKSIAEASPVKTLVLPPVWAGFSPHHMNFPGTITLRQSTLFAVTYDIIESLILHGVSRILLLNSHGGNIFLLKTVVDEIAVNYKISPIYVTYWNIIADKINEIRNSDLGGMAHACELETSLKMLFSPKEVRHDLIEDVIVEGSLFHSVDMFASNKINIYKPFSDWSKTGQIGAPSKANVETGKRILDAIINCFVDLIKEEWGQKAN